MKKEPRQAIRLPKGWKTRVRWAVLDVISLANYSLTWAQGWASEGHKSDSRLRADGARQDTLDALRAHGLSTSLCV